MDSFKNYISENEYKEAIIKLSFLVDNYEIINEENEEVLIEGLKNTASSFGIKIHKSTGLIQYISKFSKGVGKLIIAAIKGNKEEVKRIATSIDSNQVLDFLLKLDLATLHLITGPIHFIDAVTGWNLTVEISQKSDKAETIVDKLKNIFKDLKNTAKQVFTKQPEKIKAIDELESSLIPE